MGAKYTCPQAVCCQSPPPGCCCDDIAEENAPSSGIMSVQGIAVLQWGPGSAPIGKVLDETLGHLGTLDRHLLLFSSTSSLAAVRWLLHLGACWDASDANGSTCLHVACRNGGLSIVMELLRHKPLIEATDVASWTPLHIAAHMGRREAVVRLLAARASPHRRNAMGHTPAQICIDQSTKDALMLEPWPQEDGESKLSDVPLNQVPRNDSVGIPIECEPELFFVTPEPAIRDTANLKAKLVLVAVRIFNLQPSYGLAFIVATGLTDSYTQAMKLIMRTGEASRGRVGGFLGATFSLCPLVRFGIFDSMALLHTGVVSALVLAFHSMQLPEDLQMIDRLVRAVALVWWRKHRAEAQSRGRTGTEGNVQDLSTHGELVGHDLLQYLASSDVLSQLMFSTVLLHWFVHGSGRGKRREMPAEAWLALNRGIENGGTDVPDHVQLRIHSIVSRKFITQLCLATSAGGLLSSTSEAMSECIARTLNGPGIDASAPSSPATSPREVYEPEVCLQAKRGTPAGPSALASSASIEGWVQILGGDLPFPTNEVDIYAGVPEASCRFEDSGGSGLYGMAVDEPMPLDGPDMPGPSADGHAWASLCYVMLFFSVRPALDPAGAPYGVIDARRMRIASVDSKTSVVKFVGHFLDASQENAAAPANVAVEGDAPVSVVLLLPDGRWREVRIPKLEMKFPCSEEMQAWVTKLVRGPLSCKTHAL
uniref:SEC7 domain-containing protein n=1 Tax=Pyrodinium bahamense TaxID=73915 RepID=A0A7S0FFL0_9DINO